MDDGHRNLLRKNRIFIKENVVNSDDVADSLKVMDMLTDSMYEEIKSKPTQTMRMMKIMDIVPYRGSEAFEMFLKALFETGNRHVANKLADDAGLHMEIIPNSEINSDSLLDNSYEHGNNFENENQSESNIHVVSPEDDTNAKDFFSGSQKDSSCANVANDTSSNRNQGSTYKLDAKGSQSDGSHPFNSDWLSNDLIKVVNPTEPLLSVGLILACRTALVKEEFQTMYDYNKLYVEMIMNKLMKSKSFMLMVDITKKKAILEKIDKYLNAAPEAKSFWFGFLLCDKKDASGQDFDVKEIINQICQHENLKGKPKIFILDSVMPGKGYNVKEKDALNSEVTSTSEEEKLNAYCWNNKTEPLSTLSQSFSSMQLMDVKHDDVHIVRFNNGKELQPRNENAAGSGSYCLRAFQYAAGREPEALILDKMVENANKCLQERGHTLVGTIDYQYSSKCPFNFSLFEKESVKNQELK